MKVKEVKTLIINEIQKHPLVKDYKLSLSKGEFKKIDKERGLELSIEVGVFSAIRSGGCDLQLCASVSDTAFKQFTKEVIGNSNYFLGRAYFESIGKEFIGVSATEKLVLEVFNENEFHDYLIFMNICLDKAIIPFFDKYSQIDNTVNRYYVESTGQIPKGGGIGFCVAGLLFSYFYKKEWLVTILPVYDIYLSDYAPSRFMDEYKKVSEYVMTH